MLTDTDLARLTVYKWTYRLESCGFSTAEAHRLIWLRWLIWAGRLQETV